MARPRKDVSAYFGKRIKGTRLTVVREAGRDSRGRILVKVHCDCENRKVKVVVLSQVLSGHTKSCGCLKHQRYVEHTQRAVDRLKSIQIRQCFLATVNRNAPKPALQPDVLKAGYYRRTEELKSLPNSVMVTLRERVMADRAYASIAQDTGLHSAEVAWLAKHIIRPEIRQRDRALLNISKAKTEREQELERLKAEQRRRRKHRERERQLDYEEWQRGRELQEGKRQTKCMDEVFAAQAAGVRSAMR